MKDEALKLAEQVDSGYAFIERSHLSGMIRRLVEELDKQKYQNELLENSIKFAMLANNLQDKQGEPVVYWDGKHFASKEKSSLADIPLYTTPQTKPLSDEEITQLKAEIVAHKKTNELLAQKIEQLEKELTK